MSMYKKQERVNSVNTAASNILQAGAKNRDSEGNCLSRLGGRQPGAHSGRVTGEDVLHNGLLTAEKIGDVKLVIIRNTDRQQIEGLKKIKTRCGIILPAASGWNQYLYAQTK